MTDPRLFRLPLSQGVQTIRLDEDSLDYDWKGTLHDFHGTLPYENLRMKTRVTRRDKMSARDALIAGLLLLGFIALVSYPFGNLSIVVCGVILLNLVGYLILQHFRRASICVQIEPQPFGFRGELPIPDTKRGRTFLVELEEAWKESLRRRFLIRDDMLLKRIHWLESIGVLGSEEAEAERSLADSASEAEEKLIGFAVN